MTALSHIACYPHQRNIQRRAMTPKFLVLRRSFMSGRLNNGLFESK